MSRRQAIITFPERIWENTGNGWTSRPATPEDYRQRGEILRILDATSPSSYIQTEQEQTNEL